MYHAISIIKTRRIDEAAAPRRAAAKRAKPLRDSGDVMRDVTFDQGRDEGRDYLTRDVMRDVTI